MRSVGLVFLMFLSLVFGTMEVYAASGTSSSLSARTANNAFKTTYILTNVGYQYVDISATDYPQCRDGTSWGDMRYFQASGGTCPTGYAPRIIGYISRQGIWDGQNTGHDINGSGLSRIILNGSNATGYIVGICAFTFFGSGQGNANHVWVGYTIYCDST